MEKEELENEKRELESRLKEIDLEMKGMSRPALDVLNGLKKQQEARDRQNTQYKAQSKKY
ncbi:MULTISPECIES: hypothetical protein [Sphingobacterium]|uniref:Uncharacterized protein n=1 Tax=Sphingobacterium tenebrionis TaxID=3111775 RepID=A0ABU8I3Z4_9SPHI|nr:hypothetical protein [Sphingobacterium sp. CZ-2]QBR11474.1 hypothetical protein E3D81_04510 [Sphingobacterium sp. CZ-2]